MRRVGRVLVVLCGLATGLALVELAFRHRDHGAFPHLNVYLADGALGVRLRPRATERISFGGNPVTSVRINASGYRGADWAPPAADEIVVLGDSQVFGLGVDEHATFSAQLAAATHRPVLNAGVPTYGPREYEAVLRELLPRRPRTVVYVVNLANDLFEASHPNVERHAVWDGWAVRRENAPRGVRHFPGRTLLYRDSHAFFALRGAWLRWHASDEDTGVPSEGTWRDLLSSARDSSHTPYADLPSREKGWRERAQIDDALEQSMHRLVPETRGVYHPLRLAAAQPGDDVVVNPFAESARTVPITAQEIVRAAELRRDFEDKLRERHDERSLARLARRDEIDHALRPAALQAAIDARNRSALRPFLVTAGNLCKNRGIELVVVILPLDVQVSKDEWAKYGAAPQDLSSTHILSDDLALMASEAGAHVVDAWPVLAQAEPGAFLDHDLHMSDKGHAAVAHAIAAVLR